MAGERITAAVVVYNKKISESITCQRIKDIDSTMDILVLDNSEIETGNERYCKAHNIRYISMDGNKGLSKAYNKAVDNSQFSDVIVLFDDDTEITEEYFIKLRAALDEHPETDIFAPIIYIEQVYICLQIDCRSILDFQNSSCLYSKRSC